MTSDENSVHCGVAQNPETPWKILCKISGMTEEEILEYEERKKHRSEIVKEDNEAPEIVLGSGVKHIIDVVDSNEIGNPEVQLYNDYDSWYTQYFRSSEELLSFIKELQDAHDKCFGPNKIKPSDNII
ncbi:hypothetical protein EBR43_05450 [bacterium]|nr:hypothetical protein [bacterium]